MAPGCPPELLAQYTALLEDQQLNWTTHHHMLHMLGSGGQGCVFLSERRGSDQFRLPVALKIFSPHHYASLRDYDEDMGRVAHVAARVAQIQHDNLLDVHNFMERDSIRIMEMEWIDGFDLQWLLTRDMLKRAREKATPERWQFLNNVILTESNIQPRLKPGIAIQILRGCLNGLAALHREGIVHGDLKPSNIMLKRTGAAKVIDIGSAVDLQNIPPKRMCSPAYASPEVLEGQEACPQSDLCSLGYVLVEMLAGRPPFTEITNYADLLEAKRTLPERLHRILPQDVVCNGLLLNLCRGLVAPDRNRRFLSAEAADMDREGAADFHRQLVKGNLASEYLNDIRVWLEMLAQDIP